MAANWGESFKPYTVVSQPELTTGTVLRKVPFIRSTIDSQEFYDANGDGPSNIFAVKDPERCSLLTNAFVSCGLILSPDCDICQRKINQVVAIQVLPVETYIRLNNVTGSKLVTLKQNLNRASSENPGCLNVPGLHYLPEDKSIDFPESVAILNMHTIVPFIAAGTKGLDQRIDPKSIGGQDNLWFRISHSELRIRVVNEFAMGLLKVGLEDVH